jgi:hypothetical protein
MTPSQMPAENAAGSSDPQLDWDAMGDNFEGWLAPSHMQASVAEMAMVLEDWLSNGEIVGDVTSDDELDERSEVSSEAPELNIEEEQQGLYPAIPRTCILLDCILIFYGWHSDRAPASAPTARQCCRESRLVSLGRSRGEINYFISYLIDTASS